MTDQMTVLITDYTWDSIATETRILAEVGATPVVATSTDEATLIELATDADAILTCFAHVTPAVVEAGSKLQVIGRYGIGVDNIAVDTATGLGIPVTNVPAYCVDEVAEHVLAMIFCLARGVHRFDRAVREGDWSLAAGSAGAPIRRIAGKTLGIVGFGQIGRVVAERARGLQLNVIVHSPRTAPAEIEAAGARAVELETLAASSDFITLHVPATTETEHLVDARFLATMRPDAYLINAARGAVIDQRALLAALRDGRIGGAGLDVFVPERLDPDDELLRQPRLLATPHVAFYSVESVAELAASAARNVAMILAGTRPEHTVNPEVYRLPRWSDLSSSTNEPGTRRKE